MVYPGYNFSDVESLKGFVNASWYRNNTNMTWGGYYSDVLMNTTNLTAVQLTKLFNFTEVYSLGWYIYYYSVNLAQHYSCADGKNCTSTELADM